MKKKVLYLVIAAAILLLVGWTNIGVALDTQESKTNSSAFYPRSEASDYFADGEFFNDMFLQNAASSSRPWAADYPADAQFFYEEYLNTSLSNEHGEIPDYPLDGKLFVEHWVETP